MPFYTGVANSFSDLRTAIFDACVDQGWAQADADTLTKADAVVRLTINLGSSSLLGPGIILQGATALSGTDLVNPSVNTPRLGKPHQTVNPESWPMTYFIHIFDNPDEVFVVARFNVDSYWWLAFGVSDNPGIPGTGLWLSAISRRGQGDTGGAGGITLGTSSGGTTIANSASSGALFWQTAQSPAATSNNDTIQSGLDSVVWEGNPAAPNNAAPQAFNAILPSSTLIALQPNQWNGEAILLPIQAFVWRASNKASMVLSVRNARYTRVDNYTPEQIVTLGGDQWRIYPFYKKNTSSRNGGVQVDHTGTFGWAIRYDGP